MPVYEYRCAECDSKFELLRPYSRADEKALCPRCHNPGKRIMSTFACFTKSDGGSLTTVGGSSCSGCAATNCSTCGM